MKTNQNVEIVIGAEGIKGAYEEALESKKLDIVCLSRDYDQVLGSWFDREYAPKLYGVGMTTREILPDTEGNRKDAKGKTSGHEVKFLASGDRSESDMVLSDEAAILISYNQTGPFALVIRDKDIVKSLTLQFDALWKSL